MADQSLQLSASELMGMGFSAPFAEEILWMQRTIRALSREAGSQGAAITALESDVTALQDDKVERIFGQATIALGTDTVNVVEATVTAASVIFLQILDQDATLTRVVPVANAGDFDIVGDASATADVLVNWLVINP